MEDVNSPGYSLIYDGSLMSSVTKYTVTSPFIGSSKEYKFLVQSKNCGYYSAGVTLNAQSGSVPSRITPAPTVQTYDSATDLTVTWSPPSSNGGFTIEDFNIYLDNVLHDTVQSDQTEY